MLAAGMLATNLQAQTFLWAKSGGNADENFSPNSVTDKQGNTWSGCNYSGEFHLGDFYFTSAGSQDFVLSKINKNGNCVFAVNCGGTDGDAILSVDLDPAGNALIICGAFYGTTNILGTELISNGSSDAFIASVSFAGELKWIKQFGGLDYDLFEDVAVDQYGFIYTTGYAESDIHFAGSTWLGDGWPAVFACKYSPDGIEMWLRKGDGVDGGDWSQSGKIEVDKDQNVYWGGFYYGQFSLGAFTINDGNPHVFFSKLNVSGVPLWVRDYNAFEGAFYWDMDIDRTGNIYMGGQFENELNFDGYILETSDPLGTNGYLVRINGNDGSTAWVKQVLCDKNSIIHGVKVLNKNIVVAVGEYQDVASYDDLLLYNDALPEYDGMLIKANTATGAGIMTFAFNADAQVSAQHVGYDKSGNIYVTGGFKETLNLGGTPPLTSYGGWDPLFTKISGLIPREENADAAEMEIESPVSIYPNPASTSITISFDEELSAAEFITITDILGNEVMVINKEEGNTISIDISGLAPGIYYAAGGEVSARFIKVN